MGAGAVIGGAAGALTGWGGEKIDSSKSVSDFAGLLGWQGPQASGFEYQSMPLDWGGFNSMNPNQPGFWQNSLNQGSSNSMWSMAGGF